MAFPCSTRRAGLCPDRRRAVGRPLLGLLLTAALWLAWLAPALAEAPVVRVGVLSFGSVDWELDVIRRDKLDRKHGFRLSTLRLADKDAASLALLSGSVDLIVTDWLWVSHQRWRGGDVSFVAHSLAVGGLMVPSDSPLRTVADLKGKKIGIGGGPTDKTWLLLRAYAAKTAGMDLAAVASASFAAPPLLNRLALDRKLDAVANFWQFNARLKAAGFREMLPISEVLPALGIDRAPPLLGWVFHEGWADANPALLRDFLAASFDAKQRLLTSDAEWTALRPLMGAPDDNLFQQLRDSYRQGIPRGWSPADAAAAEGAYHVMVETVGAGVLGGDQALAPGTFWTGFTR
ncbi:MAG TPA: ABC transporter substrate-binding protein [Dongiaceae bacterium]|nr:ABC transporter substrate-binding protein [Dongiaceae bacterium]